MPPKREAEPRAARHKANLSEALAPFQTLWVMTFAVAAIDAIWLVAAGIIPAPPSFLTAGLVTAVLIGAAAFWTHMKQEPILRAMALSSACLLAFTVAAALFHYLGATLALPLVDPYLARAEAALGFSWTGYVAGLAERPTLERALALVYHSGAAQLPLVVILLSATRRFERLAAFVHLFAASLAVVVVSSMLLPAVGPYAYYGVEGTVTADLRTVGGTWHLQPLSALRDGSIRSIALADIRGLASFPSFHVCLAIITAWALAPVRVLGPIAIAANAAVIVGTVSAGGHYLPDVIGGALLTTGLLACRRRFGHTGSDRVHAEAGGAAAELRSRATKSAVMRAPS